MVSRMNYLHAPACAVATDTSTVIPFRWDVTRREQLGRLVKGRPAESYAEFLDDLRTCCARVVAAVGHLTCRVGGGDLLFVGRSPESLFDYLRGICASTRWFDRLQMFHLSMAGKDDVLVRREHPGGVRSLYAYMAHLGLDPASLLGRTRPTVLVDLVCSGGTFAHLVRLLRSWCLERNVRWHAARRNVRLVGITWSETKRPHGYRWHRHGRAVACLPRGAARSVVVPWRLWDYLGNDQPKVAESYPPTEWGRERLASPFRSADHAPALRLAVKLFETGLLRDERARFIAELAANGGLRQAGLRALASEVRGA